MVIIRCLFCKPQEIYSDVSGLGSIQTTETNKISDSKNKQVNNESLFNHLILSFLVDLHYVPYLNIDIVFIQSVFILSQ